MADPRVRFVGQVEDMDGMPVKVGVDYDAVTIQAHGTPIRFQSAAAGEFAQLYLSACWQAARQAGEMAAEAVPDEVKPTTTVPLECGHSAQVPLDEVNVALAWCFGCQRLRPLTNEVATSEVGDDGPVFITVNDAPPHPPRTLADYEQAGGVVPDD
jgi:hypothetical protein